MTTVVINQSNLFIVDKSNTGLY